MSLVKSSSVKDFSTSMYENNQFDGYGILLHVFTICGIDFRGDANKCRSFHLRIFPLLLLTAQINVTYSSLGGLLNDPNESILVFPFISVSIFSLILWFVLYRKRESILNLLTQFHQIKTHYSNENDKKSRMNIFINISISSSTIFLMVCGVLCGLSWLKPDDPFSEKIIQCVKNELLMLIQFNFPALVSILTSVLYYKYSDLVSDLCTNMNPQNSFTNQLRVHTMLYKAAHHLESTLSPVTFFLLCTQVVIMYVTMATFLAQPAVVPALVFECLPAMTLVPLSVVVQTICAARIGGKLEECRNRLKGLQDGLLVSEDVGDCKKLQLVVAMRQEDFPRMTAYGIMELRSNFVLTVFGSLFTYGLLIINIKNT